MKLLIAGDYIPTSCNMGLFETNDIHHLFDGAIIELFYESDLTVANLEGCFYDGDHNGILKQGRCIKASTKSFDGYKALGLDVVSLANNHSLDYGEEGLYSTMELLDAAGIKFFGAGKNIFKAREPLVVEAGGIKIGFYGIAEYEFTIATEKRAGAASFDELYTLDEISKLKSCVDYLVILYHGSKEYYRYVVPYVQKRCKRFIDKGADFVICQHSHCIGCMENYGEGTVLYGQGNFCFCLEDNEYTHTGFIIQIELPEKKLELIPVVRDGKGARISDAFEKKRILEEFKKRSSQIADIDFVNRKYSEFAYSMSSNYDWWCMGRIGNILKKLKMEYLLKYIITKKFDIDMINMLRCEAHNDLYLQALKERNGIE